MRHELGQNGYQLGQNGYEIGHEGYQKSGIRFDLVHDAEKYR